MGDFEKILDFKNLIKAYKKAKSGGTNRKAVGRFGAQALDGIIILQQQLIDKTYAVSPYCEFTVYEPKQRVIKSGAFHDAIIQHTLCDNVLLPNLQTELIYDNYAGQVGKGTSLGLKRLAKFLTQYYQSFGLSGYILKCDISKFFYNISHDLLADIVEYHFEDTEVCWLCKEFIDSTDGVGLPLGNQVSQVFAVLYLNGLDHFVKEELGAQYYGRYMDDFYIIHSDEAYLKDCLEAIN